MNPSHERAFGAPVAAPQPEAEPEIEPLSTGRARTRWGCVIPAVLIAAMAALIMLSVPYRSCSGGISKLELKQLGDVELALRSIEVVPSELTDAQGHQFFAAALATGLMDPDLRNKLVSLNGPDSPADQPLPGEAPKLEAHHCSYTCPRGSELAALLQRTGDNRRVVLTFNARNWDNYPDHGVAVLWSDGEAQWLTFEDAEDDWGITEAEWADPAGKLFGKKAPFEHTYE